MVAGESHVLAVAASLLEKREATLPAELALGDACVRVETLLRFMPGRRAVYTGVLDSRPVIVKLFSGQPRSRKEVLVEHERLQTLQDKQLPAPRVLACEPLGDMTALVLEHLGDLSARRLLKEESDVPVLLEELVAFTAAMHHKGVVQHDIHLENFFRSQGNWYVIDAGALTVSEQAVDGKEALNNLAWLLAQFPPLEVPSAHRIADIYGGGFSATEIARELRAVRAKRLKKLVKKALRNCTEFAEIQRGDLSGMCRREALPLVDDLLASGLDASLSSSEVLKDGNSATVWRTETAGEQLVVKRYNIKNIWKRLGRQVKSRARNSWLNAAYLGLVHVSTPQAICVVSRRRKGLVGTEYLVCRSVEGRMLPELCEIGGQVRHQALSQLADFFALMRLMRFSHGDSKYTNFIFQGGELQVLDLDGMERCSGRGLEADLANQRARLFESWRPREALAPAARQEFDELYTARIKAIESWL